MRSRSVATWAVTAVAYWVVSPPIASHMKGEEGSRKGSGFKKGFRKEEAREALVDRDFEVPDRQLGTSLTQNLEDVERANILSALEESGWKVKGEGNAASRLGINPSTLRSRMKKLGITRPSLRAL